MTSGNSAAIYCRISRDKEGREGAGLGVQRQEEDCRQLADRLGWTVAEVFTDNDISAYSGKPRPAYKALLTAIKAGTVDGVVVWHTDRLHRSPVELEAYIAAVEPRKVQTHAVKAGLIDLATPTGRMIARTLGNIARFEVEHMMERSRAAKKQHREMGLWQGGPRPFGFRLDPAAKGRLAQEPAEAAAIRRGYEMLLAGALPSMIGAEWNRAGLFTPKEAARGGGNPWTGQTAGEVLLRARNAALVEHHTRTPDGRRTRSGRQIIGPGQWEPIVDEETYYAARAILSDPSRLVPGGRPPRHLLSGTDAGLVCGVCGGTIFTVHRNLGKARVRVQRPRYVCDTRTLRDDGRMLSVGCTSRYQEQLDAFVERLVIERLRAGGIAAYAGPAIDAAALEARRTVLKSRLAEFAAADGITPEQLAIVSRPLIAEIEDIDQKIGAAFGDVPLARFEGAADPEDVWDDPNFTLDMKRTIIRRLIRVELLPRREWRDAQLATLRDHGKKRRGKEIPFVEESVRVTTPDGQPWGTAAG